MSHGDALTPMKAMLMGNTVNLVFDPILIFGAGLGVGGASLASLMGWLVSGFYMHMRLAQCGFVPPTLTWTRLMFPFWRAIWGLGYLIALTMLILPFSFGTMNWLLARFGPAPLGAWNLMSRVELMVALPFMGICNALVPFIGFNLGRRDYGRIRDSIRMSLIIEISGMFFVAIIFILFSKQIMGIFRPGPEVIRWGSYALRASATAFVFFPLELTLTGAAQGLKHPLYSLIATGARQLIFRIPLAVFFSYSWGVKGIYWSHPSATILTSLLCIFLIRDLLKKAFAAIGE
jgi:Na+-driven multidrug efflux pump